MKLGFGATFSRTGKFSSLMFSGPEAWELSPGLCANASSPMTTDFVTWPSENHALTVSTTEAFSPGRVISGCLMPTGIRLLRECEERIECASDGFGASVDKEADRGANGEGTGTEVSPNAVTSGA